MNTKFSVHRVLLWSFWANILFIFGMIGYLILDLIDYIYPDTFYPLMRNHMYVFLAGVFVVNASLHLFLVYSTNKTIERYYTMLCACLFDQLGSYAYLLGAVFFALKSMNSNLIWLLNTIGVCAFLIAATMNLTLSAGSHTAMWADHLNFLGSLFYLLAIVVTQIPLTKIIVLFGDSVYLICSILYLLCWFEERHILMSMSDEQYLLIN